MARIPYVLGMASSTVMAGLLVVSLANLGCEAPGLRRTDLADWELRTFPDFGMRVEIPVGAYHNGIDHATDLAIDLHPVFPSRGLTGEPRCILEVQFFRMHPRWSEQELKWVKARAEEQEIRKVSEWLNSPHESIDRLVLGSQILYRYDVQCSDVSLISATSSLMRVAGNDAPELVAQDDAAIRKILSSIQCIERGDNEGENRPIPDDPP